MIFILSAGYNDGGDTKLLISKDAICPEEMDVEKIDEAITVKAV